MLTVCLFFSPRSAAIVLGVSGLILTVAINYLTTYYLYIGIPAVLSFPYQYHELHTVASASASNVSSDNVTDENATSVVRVHRLFRNLGCGRREASLIYDVDRSSVKDIFTGAQLKAADACAALLPWYKILFYPYMLLHCICCVCLVAGAYQYKRRLLLPWLALETFALVGHVVVGGAVLLFFLSPSAYKLATRTVPTAERSESNLGPHLEGLVVTGVVRDWAVYLAHIPWRCFWIAAVASLYRELYLVNDGVYWKYEDGKKGAATGHADAAGANSKNK